MAIARVRFNTPPFAAQYETAFSPPVSDQPDPVRKLRFGAFEEDTSEVLGGRDDPGEPRHLDVEVAVIDEIDNRPVEDLFEVFHIDEVAALRVRIPLHNRFDDVVVAVTVWVVALAEDAPVPVIRLRRVVQAVGCFEKDLDGYGCCHCSPISLAQMRTLVFRSYAVQSVEF